jgi:hypothetical protein
MTIGISGSRTLAPRFDGHMTYSRVSNSDTPVIATSSILGRRPHQLSASFRLSACITELEESGPRSLLADMSAEGTQLPLVRSSSVEEASGDSRDCTGGSRVHGTARLPAESRLQVPEFAEATTVYR